MLQVIPAIDLREGACARILGDNGAIRHIYADDPLEQVILLKEAGAQIVHITDVDGSFTGHPCNYRVIQAIVAKAGVDVQLSGGINTMEHVDTLLELGVKRVVLSPAMLRSTAAVQQAVKKYGAENRIMAGVDGRDGMVATEGFETSVSTTVQRQVEKIRELGIQQILYTDLRLYGSMKGPNFPGIQNIIETTDLSVYVAGGISSLEAVQKLRSIGVAGAVIGKAVYTGAIELEAAIAAGK